LRRNYSHITWKKYGNAKATPYGMKYSNFDIFSRNLIVKLINIQIDALKLSLPNNRDDLLPRSDQAKTIILDMISVLCNTTEKFVVSFPEKCTQF
jgi:hypothetical protein